MTTPRYLPQIGGVETHVYEVSRRLARMGLDLTIATTDLTGRLRPREEVDGVKIRRVRAWPSDRDYYFAPGIRAAIADGPWDLVHCQGYHTLVTPIAMLSALQRGIPYAVTFHSGGNSSHVRNALRGLQRAALRPLLSRASALIGVSRFEADFFSRRLRIPRNRFVVIANGSDLPASPAPTEDSTDETLILSIGRLERYKGHQRILDALPLIRRHIANARLRIVGSGPYEQQLRRRARQLGMDKYVEIRPVPAADRSAMASLLSRASLVTLLSDYEAHPIAIVEALSLSRPVLVSDTSGLREFGETGQARMISVRALPSQIAYAALKQLESPITAPAVAVPTWDECAAAVLRVYQSIVDGMRPCES
ncbi:MAG TPA: glycosyltransferase family 4 protein [Chloroflexota bacterium]|nr:glycosyltransferase family 4 protein [Chloroflexota bacterium]